MPGLGALWDSLVDCICRPPRDEYQYPDELVGGVRKLFRVGRCPGVREDLTLVNKRGLRLQCSHYLPKHVRGKDGRLPCVIYCHCNSGSRRDAEEAICVLIPQGVSVFTLDFAGSGLSEGQWVSLGAEEVDDVAAAVEHLRASGRISTLGLWGRSMGAVTALMYSQRDPSIAGMVLDSPFSRLTDLMLEIVQEQRLPIPRPLARLALAAMRRSVMKRAGFDITKVAPVDAVSQSFIPALFGHAIGDTFIRISHAEAIHAAYAGDKNLIRFEGDHNSRRPEFFYNSVSIFWHNTLQLEHLLETADLHALMSGPPGAAAAGLGGGIGAISRGPATPARVLRPPQQQRVRQPLAPSFAAAVGGGAGAAAPAAAADPSRSSSESEVAVPPRAAEAAAASATGIARGGGGGSGSGDDEGADLQGSGKASRSTPWEPRLWEMELDKTLMERQRFRRMAGGLHSPPGGNSAAGGSGQRNGDFRNSAELARLLTTASNDSVVARLLGQDPPMSDAPMYGMAPTPLGPGRGGADGAAAALLLLPSTEEEEEAQLRAALQLSLLELAATGGGGGSHCGAGGGGGQEGGPGQPSTPANAAEAQPLQQLTPPVSAVGKQPQPQQPPQQPQQQRRSPEPQPTPPQPTPPQGPLAAAAVPSLMFPVQGGVPSAIGPAAAAALPLTSRSLSHEDAGTRGDGLPTAVPPLGALSGPQHSEPSAALLPAAGAAAAAREQTASSSNNNNKNNGSTGAVSGAVGGLTATAAAAAVPSVYDMYGMYSEEALLALAVQLSLQESLGTTATWGPGGGGGAAAAGPPSGGGGPAPDLL